MKKFLLVLLVATLLSVRPSAAQYYWDPDATATSPDNSATTGNNLGGGGAWDTTTFKWWDGLSAADSQWNDATGSGAIFWGPTAGTVTLATPRTATSLEFKTSGYSVTGSTLNLSGPATITVGPTLSATVGSVLNGTVGYGLNGGGTLILNGATANTIIGAVSVTDSSILEVSASSRVGGATGVVTLDNGTYRNTDTIANNPLLAATRNLNIGLGGGTIDVSQGSSVQTYSGTITGPGNTTLTKKGTGEVRFNNAAANFTFQKLVISGGIYTLGQSGANGSDGQLGTVPASFLQDQITLNSGTLRFYGGATPIVLNANRGITIGSLGGTFSLSTGVGIGNGTIPGKITGVSPTANVTVNGVSGNVLVLSNSGNDWAGSTTVSSGTLRLGASGVLPDTTAVTMANVAAATLDVNGKTETIASLAGGGTTGGIVNLNGGTLTLAQNTNTTFSADLVGATGTVIKNGAGVLTITANWGTGSSGSGTNTDSHNVTINGGVIKFSGANAGLNELGTVTVNSTGVLDMNGINDTIGDLAGDGQVSLGGTSAGLTLASNATTTFSGKLTNSAVPGVAPKLVVNKSAGSLTLTGISNDYSGGTTVSNGKLLVNNASGSSGTGTGAVTISGSTTAVGTVAGTGSISGAITVNAGGHLAAGIGGANATLTTTKVTTADDSHIDVLLGAPGSSDVLKVTTPLTGLTVATGTVLTVGATTGTVNGPYAVIDYDTDFVGSIGDFNFDNATGYEATLSNNITTTNIEVTVSSTVQERIWIKDAALGNWAATPQDAETGDAASWADPGQPNGPGAKVKFLPTSGSGIPNPAHTVTISDSTKTVGELVISSPSTSATTTGGYTIAATGPNKLVFDTYGGNATLNVASGNHVISAPMILNAPTDISVASGSTLSLTATNASGALVNNEGMTKTGAGTLAISNEWTGSGATNINEGELKFATSAGGLSSTSLVTIASGATLNMNSANDTLGDLAGNGNVTNNSSSAGTTPGLSLVGGQTTIFNGMISGAAAVPAALRINKSGGSLSLTNGSNSIGGGAFINSGTLLVNNDPNLGGSATGAGAVTVNNTGRLGGTGRIAGPITVASGGILAPGNGVGTLTAAGGLALSAGSVLNFEFNAGTSDKVTISAGSLAINGGTLNLIALSPMTEGTYTLLDYNTSFSGALTNLTLGTQPAGFTYSLFNNMSSTSVELIVTVPGDYNGNGTVDAADYVVWRKNKGLTGTPTVLQGNGNGDGVVDDADYAYWKARFGNIAPGSGSGSNLSTSGAVPEPSTIALLLMGMAWLATRRRGS